MTAEENARVPKKHFCSATMSMSKLKVPANSVNYVWKPQFRSHRCPALLGNRKPESELVLDQSLSLPSSLPSSFRKGASKSLALPLPQVPRTEHWFCFSLASPSQFLGPQPGCIPPSTSWHSTGGRCPAGSFIRDLKQRGGNRQSWLRNKAPSSRQGERGRRHTAGGPVSGNGLPASH